MPTKQANQVILAINQWTFNRLTETQKIKCEEIVTNYWLGAVIKYIDRLFGTLTPDINLFFAHMDSNRLSRCRNSSTLYKFDTKKHFVRWYKFYDKMQGDQMTRRDVQIIYDICDRYDYIEFVNAFNKSSIKSMAYINTVLESEGHKNRLTRKPQSFGKKIAKDTKKAIENFNALIDEQEVRKAYEADGSNPKD